MEEKCLDLKLSDTIIIFDSATTKGVKIENKNHQLIVTKVNEVKDGNTKISSLNEELVNTKKINVRIINLKYKKEGQEEKKLENTDLEFILDFK